MTEQVVAEQAKLIKALREERDVLIKERDEMKKARNTFRAKCDRLSREVVKLRENAQRRDRRGMHPRTRVSPDREHTLYFAWRHRGVVNLDELEVYARARGVSIASVVRQAIVAYASTIGVELDRKAWTAPFRREPRKAWGVDFNLEIPREWREKLAPLTGARGFSRFVGAAVRAYLKANPNG